MIKITNYKFWSSIGIMFLITVLVIFCGLMAYLYFNQDRMIFFPRPLSGEVFNQVIDRKVEDININTKDGIKIKGWFVKNTKEEKSPLIIYFGGNAEEVSHLIGKADQFNEWSISLINYRGYGLSEGKPSEKSLFDDAISIYDYFANRDDIESKRIILMGRSLGSGIAVYLAKNRPAKALILVTPYDSMISLAKENVPYVPVSLILKHQFNSISRAPSIKIPMLALVAENDRVIPTKHAKRLVEKWGGKSRFKIIEGEDHNSISSNEEYWNNIREFLSKL